MEKLTLMVVLSLLFNFSVYGRENDNYCREFTTLDTNEKVQALVDKILDKQIVKHHSNRHVLNKKLTDCTASQDSKIVIIAFEGTGAYEPHIPPLMNTLLQCAEGKMTKGMADDLYWKITKSIKKRNILKGDYKWSGLEVGIFSELFTLNQGSSVDWYSFPSEEVEILSGIEELKGFSLNQLIRDISRSINSRPLGIQHAKSCLYKYLKSAENLERKPKIVLVSHSSGARSLVKFTEQIKERNIEVDLAYTIDPVIEAHEVIKEILPQKLSEPLRWANYEWQRLLGKNPDYPYSKVWSRRYPKKLYQSTNVLRHINYFQLNDAHGIFESKALKFGILGSKVSKGAENYHIRDKGNKGHGTICYDEKVLSSFTEEIEILLK